MLPTLDTARLILRPRILADLDACLAMDAEPEVMRYVGGMPQDAEEYRHSLTERFTRLHPEGFGYWSVFPRQEPRPFLGWVVLVPYGEEAPISAAEIGWRLARQAWGRGFATEAASALLRHAFDTLGLDRVVATAHPENTRSFRVAERLGLAFVGDGDYFGEPCKLFAKAREPA